MLGRVQSVDSECLRCAAVFVTQLIPVLECTVRGRVLVQAEDDGGEADLVSDRKKKRVKNLCFDALVS